MTNIDSILRSRDSLCVLSPSPNMVASAKKNKKGKTISLTDFLAEDGGTGGGSTYVPKAVSWADETDDLEGDVSITWHSNDDDVYWASPIDRSILPTAPQAAREPNIDWSRLPKSPPYTAFLGNLPYDVTEDSIKEFFRGLNITVVRLPREPSNPERFKGFGYAEFEDLDSLLSALSLNEESLGNRRIQVDVADQARIKTGMIVLLAEIEMVILTKQIPTGGPVLLQTALMTPRLEGVMIALETSIEIVTIQTDIVMGIGTVTVMAHAGTWIDMGADISMMTEVTETMTEAKIPG